MAASLAGVLPKFSADRHHQPVNRLGVQVPVREIRLDVGYRLIEVGHAIESADCALEEDRVLPEQHVDQQNPVVEGDGADDILDLRARTVGSPCLLLRHHIHDGGLGFLAVKDSGLWLRRRLL